MIITASVLRGMYGESLSEIEYIKLTKEYYIHEAIMCSKSVEM
jgi:hypothetical protein